MLCGNYFGQQMKGIESFLWNQKPKSNLEKSENSESISSSTKISYHHNYRPSDMTNHILNLFPVYMQLLAKQD